MFKKFTWGHIVVLVLVSYMVFIVSFVVRLNLSELVADDYYNQEIMYQSTIDAKNNFNQLATKTIIYFVNDEIKITFPKEFNANNIKGTIELFRPSDEKKDIKIPILLDKNNIQRLPTINLLKGKYYIILDWQKDTKRYYIKHTLKIK